jgi:hypothetical protein
MQMDIEYEDWHAVHDYMSKTLHVSGVCNIRVGGFAATLEEHPEPLINPMMRTLDLVVFATGETPSPVPVEWREPWDDDEDSVHGSRVLRPWHRGGPAANPPD